MSKRSNRKNRKKRGKTKPNYKKKKKVEKVGSWFRVTNEDIDNALELDKSELEEEDAKFFEYKQSTCFESLRKPGRSDWLANHHERGQSFSQFLEAKGRKPDDAHRTIYVQPLGNLKSKRSVPISIIEEYMSIFFDTLEVKVLKSLSLEKANKFFPITSRQRQAGFGKKYTQLKTISILNFLNNSREKNYGDKDRKSKEIISIALVQPYDLYPTDDYNFVFGQAAPEVGLGVYSFARFDPNFPMSCCLAEEKSKGIEKLSKDDYVLVMRRNLDTMGHEICHLFGLDHCVHFSCLMNGSNHLEESDRSPMFLCPVCLRKLHHSLKFNIKNRYEKLLLFFRKHKIDKEAKWIKKRMKECILFSN